MCGIAGFIEKSSEKSAEKPGQLRNQDGTARAALTRMMNRMRHRGPDGDGIWESAPGPEGIASWSVHLGHRRLSLLDLEGGAQPLGNEDGSVQITYNGELFNFRDLRERLVGSGHRFKTRSDTEVIVHHYEEAGVEGLSELNGMFAFALWDARHHRLVLARDRAGIKPLYYCPLKGGGIAFASELTALMQHTAVPRALNASALRSYFFSDYVHPPETILEGVFKLPPAHFLVWENGVFSEPRAFWTLRLSGGPDSFGTASGAESASIDSKMSTLERLFSDSVENQLIADVPVGVFLSGGIDSSLVTAFGQKHARRLGAQGLQSFSIAFEEKDFDESEYARAVAKHVGTRHVEETLSVATLLGNVDQALNSLDEPMADPSIVPTFLLSKLAAGHVKAVLGGDAGDELWAGYPTYKAQSWAQAYRRVPRALRKQVVEKWVARMPVNPTYQSLEWKAKRFALRWDDQPYRRHLRWMSNTDLPALGRMGTSASIGEAYALPRVFHDVEAWSSEWDACGDFLNPFLALDFKTYLPGSVLTKVDRASMANSLEVRPPFLDNALIDWSFAQPSHLKLHGRLSKFLLKKMAERHLPRDVVYRSKRGFAIPLARWLRDPLWPRLRGVMERSPVWKTGLLSRDFFADLSARHQALKEDASRPLWALLVLDQWMRREGIHADF